MGVSATKRRFASVKPRVVRVRREKAPGPYFGPVAARLREIRESMQPELTGKELSKKIGAPNQVWISRHENGNARIPVDELPRWAAGLDHEVAVVFFPKGTSEAALMKAAEEAGPAAIRDAIALLRAWPALSDELRGAIRGIVSSAKP